MITEEEVEVAFKFMDVNQINKITLHGLKKRFGRFAEYLPLQKIRNMMGGKSDITLQDLKTLIIDNTITDYDPVAEAFKVGGPQPST
jgi:Ca2+-binding EF-hand superfamily protein